MTATPVKQSEHNDALLDASELVWVDVIHKLDEAYEDLVRY